MDAAQIVTRLDAGQRQELEHGLRGIVLERRIERMDEILDLRTRRLAVLFEDVYHPHNASAVIRSTECFGVQDIHVVEDSYHFRPSKDVVRGAGRWVSLHRHARLADALARVKADGYRVAATSVHPGSIELDEVPVDEPLVLVFGTEEVGLSEDAWQAADLPIHVPMQGFTESLNVSVTAALCLRALTQRIRQRDDWRLTPAERAELRLTWLMQEGTKARALTARMLRDWGFTGISGI